MNVVTCVYCGHEYPEGTPTSQNELLTAHIAVCAKHPMSAIIKERDDLRQVLDDNMYKFDGFSGFFCVCCDAPREGKHKPNCDIARVLYERT